MRARVKAADKVGEEVDGCRKGGGEREEGREEGREGCAEGRREMGDERRQGACEDDV